MNKPILLILAAGQGTRFGGLKQISEIGKNGETIMDFSISDALEIGFEKIVMVVQDFMLDALSEKYVVHKNLPVLFSIQKKEIKLKNKIYKREKPWGTAHALLSAKENLDQPFLIINADDYYGKKSLKLAYDFLKFKNENCAIVFPILNTLSLHGTVNRAEVKIENDKLIETIERNNISINENGIIFIDNSENKLMESTLVSMNLWGLNLDFLKYLEDGLNDFLIKYESDKFVEYQLPSIINEAIHKEDFVIQTYVTDEEWVGLTYKEDVFYAKQKLNKRISL